MSDPSEDDRHRCEVASVMRWYPDGEKVREYLAAVEKARGKAAQRLRDDVLREWLQEPGRIAAKMQNDMAGQA